MCPCSCVWPNFSTVVRNRMPGAVDFVQSLFGKLLSACQVTYYSFAQSGRESRIFRASKAAAFKRVRYFHTTGGDTLVSELKYRLIILFPYLIQRPIDRKMWTEYRIGSIEQKSYIAGNLRAQKYWVCHELHFEVSFLRGPQLSHGRWNARGSDSLWLFEYLVTCENIFTRISAPTPPSRLLRGHSCRYRQALWHLHGSPCTFLSRAEIRESIRPRRKERAEKSESNFALKVQSSDSSFKFRQIVSDIANDSTTKQNCEMFPLRRYHSAQS